MITVMETGELTDQERAVLAMVRKHLTEARRSGMTGEFNFRVVMSRGGIRDKWVEAKTKVEN